MRFKNIAVCNHCGKQAKQFTTNSIQLNRKLGPGTDNFVSENWITTFDVCTHCYDEFLLKANKLFDDFNEECDIQGAKNEKILEIVLTPAIASLNESFEKVEDYE